MPAIGQTVKPRTEPQECRLSLREGTSLSTQSSGDLLDQYGVPSGGQLDEAQPRCSPILIGYPCCRKGPVSRRISPLIIADTEQVLVSEDHFTWAWAEHRVSRPVPDRSSHSDFAAPGRDAFSSIPETPNLRPSSSSTSRQCTPRRPSNTMRWNVTSAASLIV